MKNPYLIVATSLLLIASAIVLGQGVGGYGVGGTDSGGSAADAFMATTTNKNIFSVSNVLYQTTTMGTNIFVTTNPADILTIDGRNDRYNTFGFLGNSNDLYFYLGDAINGDDVVFFSVDNGTFAIDGGTTPNIWNFRNDGTNPQFNFNRGSSKIVSIGGHFNNSVTFHTNVLFGVDAGGTRIRSMVMTNATYDAPSVLATNMFATNIVCVGALSNSCVVHASSALPTQGIIYDAHCITNDAVQIRMNNFTLQAIDPADQRLDVIVTTKVP